ncbi:preQ(1) synthase [Prochlorococcus marinus]|jgi:7-cyano-7-deazaguanine reductase|uniref:NADPH-dependent 7-cyano-7-deazaguanine reductase n=1 Tax=Prochlorococcus marinus (strain MIT 9301) TaxID=167546 RepID=QUEF_PROM0|nr:preQ(1) synthase [Prochlorococcus marinus]A3PEU9.1 RecName: Full=NADPH-dependent 7-cyano-7-deazaguanine reductase; AltName: Full=7-cyano-7-carbaguanine reductase; AltName: Full=NADPH-dependent nitrile oxidoreductase; AltName: Full=PreQ(0) reductase [Prochlorococcus marinus str. MIT 9301]ABO18274.1 GTP cyclohydrolase I-like enzyme [Prochlorococcus marinus str. MIT 9301]
MSKAKLDDSTQRPLYGERIIEESKIICFDNPNKKRIYEISIQLPEFTCKCPFSGYPDFAKLSIIYQPNLKVYELKSLKLYINSFRDIKISHEEVVNRIMDDLVNEGSPHWIHLNAAFNPRGNVSMQLDIFSGQKKN